MNRTLGFLSVMTGILLAGGALGMAMGAGCAAPATSVVRQAPVRQSTDVDVARLRARLDRNGDGLLDSDLAVAPFTFDHARVVTGFIEAGGVTPLHAAVTWETGSNVVIPGGTHPIGPLFDLLTGEPAMAAHGLLVLSDAADAAGLPNVGDVIARAGRDITAPASSLVTLDGSGSASFIEGDTLTFSWAPVGAAGVTLSDANTARPSFTAPSQPGDLVFRLTVSNGSASDFDDVTITVTDAASLEPPDATRGEAAYAANTCAVCHGPAAEGVAPFPNIQGERLAALEARFAGGLVHNGRTLSAQDIVDVDAWLATLP